MQLLILDRPESACKLVDAAVRAGFPNNCITVTNSLAQALSSMSHHFFSIAISSLVQTEAQSCWTLIAALKTQAAAGIHSCFTIVFSCDAANEAKVRLECFQRGARMVTSSYAHVELAISRIIQMNNSVCNRENGAVKCCSYACPVCLQDGLTAEWLSVIPSPSTLCLPFFLAYDTSTISAHLHASKHVILP